MSGSTKRPRALFTHKGHKASVVLVDNVALLADLALGAGEGVVLGEEGDGAGELAEEVVLALGHLLHKRLGPGVVGQLVVDEEEPLVVQYVVVVVVVQLHRRPSVVADVLDRLGVGDRVRALLDHVRYVVRVQLRVHLWVQPVHQLHAVRPPHAVRSKESNNSRGVDAHGSKLLQHDGDALVVIRQVLLQHLRPAPHPVSSPCFQWDVWPSHQFDAVSGREDQDVRAGDDVRALPLDGLLDRVQVPVTAKFPPLSLCISLSKPNARPLNYLSQKPSSHPFRTLEVRCGKRTGKRRYPSEKKRLEKLNETLIQTDIKNREEGFWRLSKLGVPVDKDAGKDSFEVSLPLLEAIAKVLKFPVAGMLPKEAFTVVRKSFDARKILKEPKFVYTVDMDVGKLLGMEPRTWDFIERLEPKIGLVEYMHEEKASADLINILHDCKSVKDGIEPEEKFKSHSMTSFKLPSKKPKIAVVGSGPSGLFAALVLGELGADVTLIERGQSVEQRGRDIGALVVRRILQSESNFCFGEGGAGTWSDGKLVTRIGRNSDSVQAVGLRIEHPQELINSIQYSALADEVCKGRGKVPVADYKVVKYVNGGNGGVSYPTQDSKRSCYSFCMCPGGQVVLTSTNPTELCINGMSFSRRSSRWANAALVVTVTSNDFDLFQCHGPLVGVEFQRECERKAALMGGGNFVVPVQTVPDFLNNKLSVTSLPPSSYRLGVKASNLHELFHVSITEALQRSITMFDEEMPGFITKEALLHGVETRTSSPVQIQRHADTCESTSLTGLYPVGEGAGYAGGIVSAAVDGMYCGLALAKSLQLHQDNVELSKAQRNTGFVKY